MLSNLLVAILGVEVSGYAVILNNVQPYLIAFLLLSPFLSLFKKIYCETFSPVRRASLSRFLIPPVSRNASAYITA